MNRKRLFQRRNKKHEISCLLYKIAIPSRHSTILFNAIIYQCFEEKFPPILSQQSNYSHPKTSDDVLAVRFHLLQNSGTKIAIEPSFINKQIPFYPSLMPFLSISLLRSFIKINKQKVRFLLRLYCVNETHDNDYSEYQNVNTRIVTCPKFSWTSVEWKVDQHTKRKSKWSVSMRSSIPIPQIFNS